MTRGPDGSGVGACALAEIARNGELEMRTLTGPDQRFNISGFW